jgi:hypothetical protein
MGGDFTYSGLLACSPGPAFLTGTSTLPDGSTSEFGNNILPEQLPLFASGQAIKFRSPS